MGPWASPKTHLLPTQRATNLESHNLFYALTSQADIPPIKQIQRTNLFLLLESEDCDINDLTSIYLSFVIYKGSLSNSRDFERKKKSLKAGKVFWDAQKKDVNIMIHVISSGKFFMIFLRLNHIGIFQWSTITWGSSLIFPNCHDSIIFSL